MIKNSPYEQAAERFAGHPVVTIATGATCAYLGDERNLREFLIADETARHLRAAGHAVFSLLIDDSLDPLNFRQLRVAVDKDPALIRAVRSPGAAGPSACCRTPGAATTATRATSRRSSWTACTPWAVILR